MPKYFLTKSSYLLTDKIFFACGLIMLLSEIWKQLTLTFLLGGGQYNWWYFPFQLCSIPMYVLLVYPQVREKTLRQVLLCFLMTYSLLGGIAVFADTSGLHYPLTALTVHSYLWHVLLIMIGICSGTIYIRLYVRQTAGSFSRTPDEKKPRLNIFLYSTGLYLACCVIAELFNFMFDRFGTINMFYINPDYRMQQLGFHELSFILGNAGAIILYIFASVFGAFVLFLLWTVIAARRRR